MTPEHVEVELWLSLVREAYQLAYGERLGELNGRYPKRFDERGLHPYSEVWGRIGMLTGGEVSEWMTSDGARSELAELVEEPERLSPNTLRKAAHHAADQEFKRRIREGEDE